MVLDPLTHRPEWLQPIAIAQLFGVSSATVRRLLVDMRQCPRYADSYLNVSQRCKLVRVKAFENFLQERSRQYMRA